MPSAGGVLQYRVVLTSRLEEVFEEADTFIVTTHDPAYADLLIAKLLRSKGHLTLIDPWRIYAEKAKIHPGMDHTPWVWIQVATSKKH